MLELRPNCECCDADLSPSDPGAMICSFECTYCTACAAGVLRGRCPNCGGGLAPRPLRAPEKLRADPASTTRVRRSTPCAPSSTTAPRAFASYSPRHVRFERIERRAEWSLFLLIERVHCLEFDVGDVIETIECWPRSYPPVLLESLRRRPTTATFELAKGLLFRRLHEEIDWIQAVQATTTHPLAVTSAKAMATRIVEEYRAEQANEPH